jgi:hypothetical protein
MHHQAQLNTTTHYARPKGTPSRRKPAFKLQSPSSRPSAPANWKPEASGLTREELREIVEEILG